ncbi:MAG: SH3 domain-containing protein [Candidatus Aminicenantes bacterium]|nr:SH3 domain-containing protein [Candidatus Aminicenantes bacterium]
MKQPLRPAARAALCAACVVLLLAETVVVNVQTTALRKEPKFYAPALVVLKAGDRLEAIGSQDGWLRVRTAAGAVGWVHDSAVGSRAFALAAVDKSLQTKASADEVALAGKGFDKQVEDSFKARNRTISFVWVDRMLKIKTSSAELERFLREGKLAEFGGGR